MSSISREYIIPLHAIKYLVFFHLIIFIVENTCCAIGRSTRAPSAIRAGTPLNGSVVGSGAATPTYAAPTPSQFEGALIKNRGLGQDILPSSGQPKRTESLYVARGPSGGGGGGGGVMPKVSLYFLTFTLASLCCTYTYIRSSVYMYIYAYSHHVHKRM